MTKAAYPTIGIAAFVMYSIVYFIGCLQNSVEKNSQRYFNITTFISTTIKINIRFLYQNLEL